MKMEVQKKVSKEITILAQEFTSLMEVWEPCRAALLCMCYLLFFGHFKLTVQPSNTPFLLSPFRGVQCFTYKVA